MSSPETVDTIWGALPLGEPAPQKDDPARCPTCGVRLGDGWCDECTMIAVLSK